MEKDRFEQFSRLISSANKSIQRLKATHVEAYGLKSVHALWLYHFLRNPEGLTASALARITCSNRSLISRDIHLLYAAGFLETDRKETGDYNRRYRLSESGRALALEIENAGRDIQAIIGKDIPIEDMENFYRVLFTLTERLEELSK